MITLQLFQILFEKVFSVKWWFVPIKQYVNITEAWEPSRCLPMWREFQQNCQMSHEIMKITI